MQCLFLTVGSFQSSQFSVTVTVFGLCNCFTSVLFDPYHYLVCWVCWPLPSWLSPSCFHRMSIHRENLHVFAGQTAAVCFHPLQQEQLMIAWLHTFMTFTNKCCLLVFMSEVFPPRLIRHLFNVLRASVDRFRQLITATMGYWTGHSQYCSVFCKVITVFHSYKYLSYILFSNW